MGRLPKISTVLIQVETLARSFAQLARSAEKTSSSVAVPKKPLDSPPLHIHQLGAEALRVEGRRVGKVDETVRDLARDMLRSMYTCLLYTSPSPRDSV